MFSEKNTGNNLPAQIDLFAAPGAQYDFLFIGERASPEGSQARLAGWAAPWLLVRPCPRSFWPRGRGGRVACVWALPVAAGGSLCGCGCV